MKYAFLLASICLVPTCKIAAQDDAAASTKPAKVAIYKDPISDFEPGDAKAPDVVKLLNEQFPNLTFSAEPTTNRIYGRVPESQVDDIEEFVHELANVAAEHKHEVEKLRQKQIDKEAAIQEREEQIQQERAAKDRAELEAGNAERAKAQFETGLTFLMPFEMRMATAQLRNAELKLKKLQANYGPNHPEVRDAELAIEAINYAQQSQSDLFAQFRFEGYSPHKTKPIVHNPITLAEVLKKLRPDIDVEIVFNEKGYLLFRGSETDVAEAERVVKALQDVTLSSGPATLQDRYEDAERSAAQVADQLRDANSGTTPDTKRIAELRKDLTASVELAFELRLRLQQHQLELAEADLMTARARLIRREKIAKQIVKRRVEELANNDDTAWNLANVGNKPEKQSNVSVQQIDEMRQGLTEAQAKFEEATATWARERKKLTSDRKQLFRQVDDLREKLKAATRVSFDRSSSSNTQNENPPPVLDVPETDVGQKPDAPQDSSDASKSARLFGIRFGKVADLSEYKSNFRGGIHITSVIANTRADKAGIKSGDILLGIDAWETTSLEDLAFVLRKVTDSSDKDSARFHIMRNGETLSGEMAIPAESVEGLREF
ncbi:MAG: PDZ domain-containing protein [Planctomycetales bacterium]